MLGAGASSSSSSLLLIAGGDKPPHICFIGTGLESAPVPGSRWASLVQQELIAQEKVERTITPSSEALGCAAASAGFLINSFPQLKMSKAKKKDC